MPGRISKPWYRGSKRQWYTTVNGKQHPLGVTDPAARAAAVRAMKDLISRLESGSEGDGGGSGQTVAEAVDAFLAAKRGGSRASLDGYRHYCKLVRARLGTESVAGLSPAAVEGWVATLDTLGPDSRRNLLMTAEAVLRHAGRPLVFRKPPRGSRGAGAVIPEAVYLKAVGAARGDLRPLLVCLWETGARPGEVRGVSAEMVDWAAGVATLAAHKTAGRTGRPRLIYLTAAAVDVLAGQRDRYGGGLLFRTRLGRAFTLPGLTQAVWRVAERIGHPGGLSAYGFRHTWATRAMAAGVPDTHVAAVLGHTSTAMVNKHYSHINANARLMRDVVERLSRRAA